MRGHDPDAVKNTDHKPVEEITASSAFGNDIGTGNCNNQPAYRLYHHRDEKAGSNGHEQAEQ